MLRRRELEACLGKDHIAYVVSERVTDVISHIPGGGGGGGGIKT